MVQALNDMYTACLCRHCLSMNYCILDPTLRDSVCDAVLYISPRDV